MSRPIDRSGWFKAKPKQWHVWKASSGAIAINITLEILAQWNGESWDSWFEFATHHVLGAFYVIGKEGKVNSKAVEQLSESMGWDGDLRSVKDDPPRLEVVVQVKESEYEGKTSFKVNWMHPDGYTPSFGASPDEVKKMQAEFGPSLRAAASSVTKPNTPAAPSNKPAPSKAGSDDDLPF